MTSALRHSHIAIRRSLDWMAKVVDCDITTDIDDLSDYRYFDLFVRRNRGSVEKLFRFAERQSDPLVHILMENPEDICTLSEVLGYFDITKESELSISTDQNGKFLRDPAQIVVAIQNARNEGVPPFIVPSIGEHRGEQRHVPSDKPQAVGSGFARIKTLR